MKKQFRALREWHRGLLARARARGAWHLFWLYLSMGLVCSLYMAACGLLLEYCHRGAPDFVNMEARAPVYFAGGLLFGLVMWFLQEMPGTGRRDPRR